MVNKVTSFGKNGVHDFILVRATAIILALYSLYLFGFFLGIEQIKYYDWVDFWDLLFNKVFTMLALVSLLIHAWIGLWQVLTDYIKPPLLRGALQFLIVIVLMIYLLSGFFILWGV